MINVRLVERVGVEHRGVARAGKADEAVGHVDCLVEVGRSVHPEDGAQLLLGQRLLLPDDGDLANDHSRPDGQMETAYLTQLRNALPHNVGVEFAVNGDLGADLGLS